MKKILVKEVKIIMDVDVTMDVDVAKAIKEEQASNVE